MSTLIAVTGKGGVGKTTLSALLIRQLLDKGMGPALAIDADPNSCFDAALGVQVEKTVGSAREEVRDETQKGLTGISKHELLLQKIAESLVESKGFDLISMGRPEGAGCYCYANNVLKSVIAEMSGQYPYVVLDNEAGLENLSRRIVQKVNALVLVSDASGAGMETLKRLYSLASEMGVTYDKLFVVINRLRGSKMPEKLDEVMAFTKAGGVFGLPDDDEVARFAENNRSFFELSPDNAVLRRVGDMIEIIRK